jgi:hypothetical protein
MAVMWVGVLVGMWGLAAGWDWWRARRLDRHFEQAVELVTDGDRTWCAVCDRWVDPGCVQAHIRLQHRPRPRGPEDRVDWR